ncbi:MAG TPA: DoxX family protein [Candidatus Eisenbacteria bacterium]
MQPFLGKFETPLYTALRIVAGFMFSLHGAQKLFGFLGNKAPAGNMLMLSAGVIEFFGGILIAIGLFTSFVAFLASGQMAVAYFKSHAPSGFWPTANHGELAALYCFLWLFVSAHGAGPYSLDSVLFGAPRKRAGGPSSVVPGR